MYNHTIKRPNATFITNGAGFVELMNSAAVQELLREEGTKRVNALTDGAKIYKAEVLTGNTKSTVIISADSYEAKLSNLKNNDLLKAL